MANERVQIGDHTFELENAMREAGVEGVPQIDLYDEAD